MVELMASQPLTMAPRIVQWFKNHIVVGTLLTLLILYVLYELLSGVLVYSRDAYITTDVIAVVPEVSGPLATLAVKDNQGQIFHFAIFRGSEVICGVVAATFVELLLYPRKAPATPADKSSAPAMDRPTALRLAMIGGVAVMLIPILWSWLNLPSLAQIAVTCLVVLDRDGASTHFRGLQRVMGCLAGGAFGPPHHQAGSRFILDLVRHAGRRCLPFFPDPSRGFALGLRRYPGRCGLYPCPRDRSARQTRLCQPSTASPECSVGSGFSSACAWSSGMRPGILRRVRVQPRLRASIRRFITSCLYQLNGLRNGQSRRQGYKEMDMV
jgi:hypothetical protein